MRYLFVTTGDLEKNASFVRLRELGRALSGLGLDVQFLVDPTEWNQTLVGLLDFGTVHLLSSGGRLAQLFERRNAIRRIRPDTVHILNPQPFNCLAVAASRVPVVVDWDELLSSRSGLKSRRYLSLLCEAYGRRKATFTVVASRHQQTVFRDRYGVESLYLPYACYLPTSASGANPFSEPTAVYLGNFYPDFDHDLIIDAWRVLKQADDVVPRLELIGDGADRTAVQLRAGSLGLGDRISLPGYLTGQNLWNRLVHAHVLLFPIRDTIGNRMRCPSKTFAYMQARRSIITNRVGEVAEALGDQAHYVEPTAEGFAAAVRDAFSSPAKTVDYALARHTWTARAETLLNTVVSATPNHAKRTFTLPRA